MAPEHFLKVRLHDAILHQIFNRRAQVSRLESIVRLSWSHDTIVVESKSYEKI